MLPWVRSLLLDGSRFKGRLPCLFCRHARRRKTRAQWQSICGRCRGLTESELNILYWYQEEDSDRVVVPPNILRHSRENSDARYQSAHEALTAWGVPRGGRVLDIGCGISAQAPLFRDFSYYGADLNRVRLRRGRSDHRWASYAAQDIRQMGWRDGAFAAILCLEVIEHLPIGTRLALAQELLRVLQPGGLIVLSTPNGTLTPWKHVLGRRCERSHERELAPTEIVGLVGQAGGHLLATQTVDNLVLPAGKLSAITLHLMAGMPRWRRRLQRLAAQAGYETLVYVASKPGAPGAEPTSKGAQLGAATQRVER